MRLGARSSVARVSRSRLPTFFADRSGPPIAWPHGATKGATMESRGEVWTCPACRASGLVDQVPHEPWCPLFMRQLEWSDQLTIDQEHGAQEAEAAKTNRPRNPGRRTL